ncbi:IS701 family transposase [Streptomyces sp. NPDC059874]|uniref:IS701 family transposase n=1 Tax=Streptomyces sp. NPDC059874 TaxID=3346983 RepID=UPI003657E1FC
MKTFGLGGGHRTVRRATDHAGTRPAAAHSAYQTPLTTPTAQPAPPSTLPAADPTAMAEQRARMTEAMIAELVPTLFSSLRRSDQRARGEQYLRGLLYAEGRKSIRNLAGVVGGAGTEQSLHHFITESTWDWAPMRAALARHVERMLRPKAWVIQSMPIQKAGERSVGIDRRFVPELGYSVHGQHSFGLWMASEAMSAPVNWNLSLSPSWLQDEEKRRQANIPDWVEERSPGECAAAVALDALEWNVERRPVIMPSRDFVSSAVLGRFHAAGIPVIARLRAMDQLRVADTAMPGYGAGPIPVSDMLQHIRGLRRPVEWLDEATGTPTVRSSLVAGIRVEVPQPRRSASGPQQWLLMGEWTNPGSPPSEFWLTDLTSTSLDGLTRLAKLAHRAALDSASTGERAGLRDFAGRSFQGWHRHLTLASAAHTVAIGADRVASRTRAAASSGSHSGAPQQRRTG